jgi:hypothetical protein
MADVEEKVEYEVEWKRGAARDMDNAADRFRAGANAIGKKVRPPTGTLKQNTTWGRQKKNSASLFFDCI